jgi:HAD superfamily hydrolase (TIGR01509 family)
MTQLVDALGRRITEVDLIAEWSRAFVPNADVLEVLTRRTERVVLFTNNGPIVEHCLAGPLRAIAATCAEIVCSWRLRARKPDAAAYQGFVELCGATAEQLLLVDDSPRNVEAARAAGWAAEVVTNADDLRHALSAHEHQ